jgi:hypothetical protein
MSYHCPADPLFLQKFSPLYAKLLDLYLLAAKSYRKISIELNTNPQLCGVTCFGNKFIYFAVLGLELGAFTLSHSTSPIFCDRVFRDRVSQTICPGWLQSSILLISAS